MLILTRTNILEMEFDLIEKCVYLLLYGSFGRNLVIFGVNMSSSINADNKGNNNLILGRGPTQGLGEHSLTAEKIYSINFTDHRKKCCLSLHYNGANSYLFVNSAEMFYS